MDFLSLAFGGLALAALLAFHAVRDVRWRIGVVTLATGVYIASFNMGGRELWALGLFLAIGYGLVLFARAKPGGALFAVGVVAVVALFAWLKRYSALAPLPQPPSAWATVGLSYILFRVLQLAVDEYQGEGRAPIRPLEYLLFTCSFLTFASGPILFNESAALLRTHSFGSSRP